MLSLAAARTLLVGSVGVGGWAANQVNNGPDLLGIAAVISAVGGVIVAVGTLALGWRSNKNTDKDDAKDELILELLRQQLDKTEERPKPRKRRAP